MQLHEILCVSKTNSVAILLYMISACAMIRYHCAVSSVLFRKASEVETLTVLEVLLNLQ
jgi:hypothetical protein